MDVTIDPGSGFCFGVNHAIQIAEAELDAGNPVYSLGEMVHNRVQMDRLKARGLEVISRQELIGYRGKMVLFRAHGEPPDSFEMAKDLGVKVINATCPIVTRLQQKIRESAESGLSKGSQLVIFGKPGHAEVTGLLGYAGSQAILVSNENDLGKLDFSKPVELFSQTTMDAEAYQQIGEDIRRLMSEARNTDLVIHKSACRQVSGRAPALRVFAAEHDIILFVGGSNSANGAYLFGVCKATNSNSYFISDIHDIDPAWFTLADSVGVTGATSTPGWLLVQVAEFIKKIQ